MNVAECFRDATGAWTGINLLRMMPDDQYGQSDATATVHVVARGNGATMSYTWADGDKPQDGHLLITNGEQDGTASAVWLDSWHQSPQWMVLHGTVDDVGRITVEGTYPEDNAWRITIVPAGGELRMTMHNIMPSMDLDYQAVEVTFQRTN